MIKGRYIIFEGIDGSGKSTQARILADTIQAKLTREPGATIAGEKIRELILHSNSSLEVQTEALLMAADRAELISKVILPAITNGTDIVSDRSYLSSYAYQGFGDGYSLDRLRELNEPLIKDVKPNYIIFIDTPVEIALSRIKAKKDRFEGSGKLYFDRVRDGYLLMASTSETPWLTIDGELPIDEISEMIMEFIAS
jgi:dTMP kinase